MVRFIDRTMDDTKLCSSLFKLWQVSCELEPLNTIRYHASNVLLHCDLTPHFDWKRGDCFHYDTRACIYSIAKTLVVSMHHKCPESLMDVMHWQICSPVCA